MPPIRIRTAAEQVAEHLRSELLRGMGKEAMPGGNQLAAELGVGTYTVAAALRILEKEGLLKAQGRRRRRQIVPPENLASSTRALNLRILLYGKTNTVDHYILDIKHRLQDAGHVVSYSSRTLVDMNLDLRKVARHIQKNPADGWIVICGTREVLEWCAQQPTPVFALAGRRRGARIASIGPEKVPALLTAVRRLVALGHRRIVMLAREVRRKPQPGTFEQAFLDELAAHDIPTGDYNLPHWEENREGFLRCLDALFEHTPPTALIVGEMPIFVAARQYLAERGIHAPRDVSMVCDDPDPVFDWCHPSVAHINWDSNQWSLRIVRWAANIASGKDDRRQSHSIADFVEGGTIGPAPKRT